MRLPIFSFLASLYLLSANATHYPLQFSIPEKKMVSKIPAKDRDFAFLIPGQPSTYIYTDEATYYHDYQRAYFAITMIKGGWDCMRHYEILANGCIPYFLNLEQCPQDTMVFFPKELVLEAMHLPGVNYETLSIDHSQFDEEKYREILQKLLDHTREHLTCHQMAKQFLNTIHYKREKPILFLSWDIEPDYLRCTLLTGLKQLLKEQVIDFPRIPHIYTDNTRPSHTIYGRGFSYTNIIPPDQTDRSNLERRIQNREFEKIIYGSMHRGMPFLDLVQKYYSPDEIIFICGEDIVNHECIPIEKTTQLFIRESANARSAP